MKNYFTCKRIILITPLRFFVIENVVISNYNGCKLLIFTQQNRRASKHTLEHVLRDKYIYMCVCVCIHITVMVVMLETNYLIVINTKYTINNTRPSLEGQHSTLQIATTIVELPPQKIFGELPKENGAIMLVPMPISINNLQMTIYLRIRPTTIV